ncbi:MAG: sulfite exporter TauE/SafE family protein [Thermodesulfobacteriota bacterium]
MEYDSFFWMAMQSSVVLGLIHGINPCGHSWLVLAPFVAGKKDGRKVSFLTIAFLSGTAAACIALGASLGAISQIIPNNLQWWLEIGTGVALAAIGIVLIVKPTILHNHDHTHQHHGHNHESKSHHHAEDCSCSHHRHSKKEHATAVALFGVGFVNMIIPCPTVAIMYGYALDSGNIFKATLVFAAYALTTAMAVAAVIYAIFKVTSLLHKLNQHWVENVIMRTAGVITLLFSTISLAPHIA